jgi:hypothetical protein
VKALIRGGAITLFIVVTVGIAPRVAPGQSGVEDPATPLQQWEGQHGGINCHDECPGTFCCKSNYTSLTSTSRSTTLRPY